MVERLDPREFGSSPEVDHEVGVTGEMFIEIARLAAEGASRYWRQRSGDTPTTRSQSEAQ